MRRNLLLAAASAVIFFGLVEVALRLSGRVPTEQLRSPALEAFDSIPGMYDPGQDFVDRVVPSLAYRVRINALGFRGRDLPLKKAPGTVRVLCVGDSYAFGPYVEDEQTFPARLEGFLRENLPAPGPAVEVFNGGANGFTIEDELIFLRDKAYAIEPDVVLLVYCQNDVLDLARARPTIEVMREHARLKSTFVIGPALGLLQHTAIFNGMQRTAALIKVMKMRAKPYVTSDAATPEQWRTYRETLSRFVDLVRQRGTRMAMVVWISADQMSGIASMAPQEKLAGFGQDLGFEVLDLAPAIRRLQESGVNPYLTPLDGHPGAPGYEAAARATARWLVERGYLAPPARP